MANEIWHSFDSASTLYALIFRQADQFIYDVGDAAFEAVGTWNDARAGECDVVMSAVNDIHFADFPTVAAGVYYVEIKQQAGGSPDTDDIPVAQGVVYWDGTAEQNMSTLIGADGDTLEILSDEITAVKDVVDTIDVDTSKQTLVIRERGTGGGASSPVITIRE